MTATPIETSEQIEHAASLWAVKDRPLSPEDEASLREWLAGDPRRRGALLRAQATWLSVSRARALGPTTDWPVPSARRIATPSRRHLLVASGAAGGLTAAGLAAAGLAAAGLAGIFIGQHRNETVTEMGEIRRLPMSDGSIAAINTESRIKVDMSNTQRRIDLVRGEAWFKVARNKERPFVVSAGLARVEAVGTAFSVKRQDGGAEVLVTEGTVRAWLDGADQDAVLLNAGDRTLITHKSDLTIEHAPQAIDSALAWREGQIALNGKSLAEAAEEYNRYNQIKIIIQDAGLGNERLLGRFSTDDPDAFSSAVAQAFGAEITRTDKAIYIGVKKNQTHHTEL